MNDQPKISEPKTVEIGGVRYKSLAAYVEEGATREDIARIVWERYGLQPISAESAGQSPDTQPPAPLA